MATWKRERRIYSSGTTCCCGRGITEWPIGRDLGSFDISRRRVCHVGKRTGRGHVQPPGVATLLIFDCDGFADGVPLVFLADTGRQPARGVRFVPVYKYIQFAVRIVGFVRSLACQPHYSLADPDPVSLSLVLSHFPRTTAFGLRRSLRRAEIYTWSSAPTDGHIVHSQTGLTRETHEFSARLRIKSE